MKQLIIFKNNQRIIADTLAIIYPQHPDNIVSRDDISEASDDEIEHLKKNPHDDTLIAEIKKRKKL